MNTTVSASQTIGPHRQVPEAVSRGSFRDFVRNRAFRFGVCVSAGLAIAGCSPSQNEAEPTPIETRDDRPDYGAGFTSDIAAERVAAEEAAIEGTYGNLVIIAHELTDHATLQHDGEQYGYKVLDRDRIYQEILAGMDSLGNFDAQSYSAADRLYFFPMRYPSNATRVNELVAYKMSERLVSRLTDRYLGMASRMRLTPHQTQEVAAAQNLPHARGCAAIVMPESADAARVVSILTDINKPLLEQLDLADLHQLIANHEFGHCADPRESGIGEVDSESYADVYAIARHIQVHGNNGFAERWRDIRTLSVINHGDRWHDTLPILDRAIPALIEADSRGELDNVPLDKLYETAIEITAEAEGLIPADLIAKVKEEQDERAWFYSRVRDMPHNTDGTLVFDENLVNALPDDEHELVETMVEDYNTAYTNLFGADPRGIEAFAENVADFFSGGELSREHRRDVRDFAFARYRANIENLIQVQESNEHAYIAVSHALGKVYQPESDDLMGGLTRDERYGVLNAYRNELAEELGLTPEPQERGLDHAT